MKTTKLILAVCFLTSSVLVWADNYGLYFNGTSNRVGVQDSPELNPESGMTIEAWINAEEWAGSIWGANILSKQATGPDRGYGLTVGENGRIEFNHSINEGWNAVQTPPILGLNSWYHIAAVYDLSTMKIYVNGILQATSNATGTPTLAHGQAINLGDNPTWPGRFFKGVIDEVRIWNAVRTENQIQEFMMEELEGDEEGLVAYWNMNEGSGNTINDISGNENHGTLLGMSDDNWVDGFAPPGTDIGIEGIASPSVIGTGFTSSEHIKIDVKNFATNDVHEFEIFYSINDGEPVSETIQETILAFQSKIIAFSEPVDLSGYEEIELKVWVEKEGDGNPINDMLVETISQSTQIMLYDNVLHNFGSAGQTHFRTLYMPEDLSGYKNITLNLDLYCPAGGCDPWDQPGMLYIQKDNVSWEIARYITPYGVACGGWSFDLTDFKPIMEGKTIFENIIRVWGASGWLVDMELILEPGQPEYHVTKIDRLWNEDYWVYGDPDISYEFDPVSVNILDDTDWAHVRMTMTGHGQGNTLNAAEFSRFSHFLHINNNEAFEMDLWKDDCNVNPCSPQNGTWQFARAGWCPGQDVQPWYFNLVEYISPGDNLEALFVLAEYTNLLNSGYNNTTHTEPHYRIHAYLVQYALNEDHDDDNTSAEDIKLNWEENNIMASPNPSTGQFNVVSKNEHLSKIKVYDMNGRLKLSHIIADSKNFMLDLSALPNGLYFIKAETRQNVEVLRVILQK